MELTNSTSLICQQIYANSYIIKRYWRPIQFLITWKGLKNWMNTLRNFNPITKTYQPLIRKKHWKVPNSSINFSILVSKVASILAPLTRLWNIMEAEQAALPDNDEKETSGHTEIAALFEKSILLLG